MSVVLRPETLDRIQERVESGQFADADAVVAQALELMARKEQYEELKAAIAVGMEQIERGETVEVTDDFFERVLARAKERSRLGLPVSNDVKP